MTLEGNLVREGKTKILYKEKPGELIMEFKDSITAMNGRLKETIPGKGEVCSKITEIIFSHLEKNGVNTHFISRVSEKKIRVKELEMYPIEVVCRNIAFGSLLKRLPLRSGEELKRPVIEFYYKSDELGDPMLNEDHLAILGVSESEIKEIRGTTLKTNELLKELFRNAGLKLVDFKLEFGKYKSNILIGDELSPDNFRAWLENRPVDKDLFRMGEGRDTVIKAYLEVLKRLEKVVN